MISATMRSLLIRSRCAWQIQRHNSDVVSSSSFQLNSTMKQLVASRQYKQALDLFDRKATLATDASLILALKASTKLADEQRGVRIHQQLSSNSLHNPYIRTSLIQFYMHCRRVDDAERIFASVETKTLFIYGAMIKGYLSNNVPEKVIDILDEMASKSSEAVGAMPLKARTQIDDTRSIALGKEIVDRLPNSFLEHHETINSVIDMLMKEGDLRRAERLFEQAKKKNVITYGAMMQNYVQHHRFAEALNFVERIPFPLNKNLLVLVFKTCALLCDARAKTVGIKAVEQMPSTFLDNDIVVNSAIHMLMKFGDVQGAERLFEQAKKKTNVTYGTMMQGYSTNGQSAKTLQFCKRTPRPWNEIQYTIVYKACAALCDETAKAMGKKVLEEMPKMFLKNVVVITSVIHMFMRFTEVESAERFGKHIKTPDRPMYGALINGYRINEQPHKCLSLFDEMKKKGMTAHEPIALSLVGACAQIGMQSISQRIIEQISHLKYDLQLQNSLIDMWGKCGHIARAHEIFKSVTQPDVFTYTNMINGYGRNGMGYEAINIYERMPTTTRNAISHVCVLNACSHAGLVDKARSIFETIEQKTEHIVTTMVDCLSRLSLFTEAQQLIDDYEKSHSPDLVIYMALLSGARNHRQVALSQQLYDRMQRLFPDRRNNLIAASVLVSNTYSSSGDEQQAREVRLARMKRFGKNTAVGVSWTEVNGELVRFQAHDRSHPRSADIYAQLDRVAALLKQHGHEFDAAWITRPLNEGEDIESALCGHSEKLAIGYNLIQRPQPSFIQITKNLRVCGDCHRAAKLIAKLFQCEIVVRDANRIHHFSPDGQCSCHDHF